MDSGRDGEGQNGSGPGLRPPWAPRNTPLPQFSRAFNLFMGVSDADDSAVVNKGGFFVPSYLKGSTYIHRLEEAHMSKMAQKEEHNQQSGLPTGTNTVNLHSKPQSHRGMAFDVVEKPLVFDEDEAAMPLPTRWNRDDKYGGLEVLADGMEVKYTSPRGQGEREHEACAIRADHHMPQQCGIYYFEVTILSGRRDECVFLIPLLVLACTNFQAQYNNWNRVFKQERGAIEGTRLGAGVLGISRRRR